MKPWCPYDFIDYKILKTASLDVLKFTVSWSFSTNSFDVVWNIWSTVTQGIWRKCSEKEGSILNLEMQGLLFYHKEENYPFPSREDLWNTEVEIPSSAILRFLDIITKPLRSIYSSLQSLPEDNFSKNWDFMIIDIIPDTISWLKMNLERYTDSISKAMDTSSIPKILILWYFDIYSCLILRMMLNLIQSQSSHL